ncbi:hypothetical protein FACS189450_05680 [Spirochaetia bacterium]|nr:hypothetical protein FACS189450_05680 [Spirochaetia bacterium]
MLEREYAFFQTHKDELRAKYPHKQLVIVGEAVWGVFDTPKDATLAASECLEPGTFMFKWSDDADEEITINPVVAYAG